MPKANTHSTNHFNKSRDILVCLFLVISTLFVYWQVSKYDFVDFDDNEYVYDNRHVQGGFTLENIKWAFTTNTASIWHPLTWLSHMMDYQFYGLNPGRHHLINLLFHIVNTLLLFFVFRKMTGQLWQSAFIASLFAGETSVTVGSDRSPELSMYIPFLANSKTCSPSIVSFNVINGK